MPALPRAVIAVIAVLAPGAAMANAAFPTMIFGWPWMILWLLPVVLIEARVYTDRLALQRREARWLAAQANALSTLLGVPLTYAVFAALALLFIDQFGWLDEGETMIGPLFRILTASLVFGIGEPGWAVPVALLVLFVPFWAASWWIEARYIRWRRPELDYARIASASRRANLVSYALMYLALLPFVLVTVYP